ncbi:pentapeptide repeat-containing protein [Kribbella sp. DT2]|uniref:pentapeptide repeat-containing protein n=1 Tax=Kribbella sp. DT2 TaxID=3393427 RepID=UPI003CF4CFC5
MEFRVVRDVRVMLPSDELDESAGEGDELRGVRVVGAQWQRAEWDRRAVGGVVFERVDLSSARWSGVKVERTRFTGCKLSGLAWSDGSLGNVLFEDCRLDYASFRQVDVVGPVTFVNCTLTEASVVGGRWRTVAVESCRLEGMEFDGCDLRGADLRGNLLSGVRGVESLRGVTVAAEQVDQLAAALVADLGITVDGRY